MGIKQLLTDLTSESLSEPLPSTKALAEITVGLPSLVRWANNGTAAVNAGSRSLTRCMLLDWGAVVDANSNISSSGANQFLSAAIDALNESQKLSAACVVDGVPIYSSSVSYDRTVEVSTKPVISTGTQTSIGGGISKDEVMYNAIPQPRTWEVTGYLDAATVADAYMFSKPSIMTQLNLLDALATTRKPVWFKDNRNRFFKVMITKVSYQDDPKSHSALGITLHLQEYVVIQTQSELGAAVATFLGTIRTALLG